MEILAVLARAGHQEDRAGRAIDHRRAENADVADHVQVGVVGDVGDRDRRDPGHLVREVAHPQRRSGAIGVEGVDAIVHCRDIEDIARAAPGDLHGGKIKRLGEDGAIHVIAVELAEGGGLDIGGVQRGLLQVRSGRRGVVPVHQKGGLSGQRGGEKEGGECTSGLGHEPRGMIMTGG